MATTFLSKSLLARGGLTTCRACASTSTAQFSLKSTLCKATRPLSTLTAITRASRASPLPQTLQAQVKRTYASAAPTEPLAAARTSSSATSTNPLTWDQFFTARIRRRYFSIGTAAACALAAAAYGSPLIGALDLDTSVSQATGVDPLIVVVGGSFAVAVAGWFLGRVAGGAAFSLYARQGGWQKIFVEKEKSFFARIKRYRADPTSSSPQNPVPDYYGEKISSVKDYRRWLKDQRAYTKKMYRGVR